VTLHIEDMFESEFPIRLAACRGTWSGAITASC